MAKMPGTPAGTQVHLLSLRTPDALATLFELFTDSLRANLGDDEIKRCAPHVMGLADILLEVSLRHMAEEAGNAHDQN
jgi:hypothetical protein